MVHWLQHETGGLLLLCAVSIAVLLFLIIKVKLEPFIALIVSSLALALVAGLSVDEIVGTALSSKKSLLETGFGGLLGHIAPIVGLGTILGAILERSGGADVLTRRLLGVAGERGAPLAMGLAGLIFGIPVFFDVGIFVLAPLVYITAKQGGRSLVLYALPLLSGLSMTHAFLPPHPGPVAAAGLLGVPLGWLIVFGLICGIPAFLVSGVAWGAWIGKRVIVDVPEEYVVGEEEKVGLTKGEPSKDDVPAKEPEPEPSLTLVGLIIAVPLVLILLATFGTVWWEDSPALPTLTFLGNPVVALTIAVLLAMYLLGIRRGITSAELSDLAARSLRPVGMILLVIGGGAFFGAVVSATGVGKALADTLSDAGLPVIVLAYLIACGLRVAQGSATVAIVTTGGIVAPLVQDKDYSQQHVALIAIAISAGSIIASHVNDGGFWIISRYFNMSVRDTLRTWTVLETILSVVGFAMAALLSTFI
ncbi:MULTISPECIES: GntP family permease [Actinomadura]|uniref:GntP family permease n=1 Tax=Actinomadura litoris TaxID=2678616 RepID=A0A7K1KV29_9ACTN|nr:MULTISPECIES: gluconate:H+ symporter [Actinomadura]MBT2207385.1 GntP family permease [Actinomadura sp. NEAU-AAG7]MUN35806.1 GntP family permease [Actinomadura litoris]